MSGLLSKANSAFRINKLPVLLLPVVLLTGCSAPKVAMQPEPDVKDICGQLGYIFENSANGFRAIREQPNYQNKITIWQSLYQPLETKCEIWQWSNRYSYVCSRVLPDKQTALNAYNDVVKSIGQCLAPEWQQRTGPLPDGKGEQTEYLLNGKVRGSTQRVNTKGLFSDDWTVYVLISSPGS